MAFAVDGVIGGGTAVPLQEGLTQLLQSQIPGHMVDGDLGDGFLPGEGGVGGEEDVFRQRAVAGDDGPDLLIGKASSHKRGQGEPGGSGSGPTTGRRPEEAV